MRRAGAVDGMADNEEGVGGAMLLGEARLDGLRLGVEGGDGRGCGLGASTGMAASRRSKTQVVARRT